MKSKIAKKNSLLGNVAERCEPMFSFMAEVVKPYVRPGVMSLTRYVGDTKRECGLAYVAWLEWSSALNRSMADVVKPADVAGVINPVVRKAVQLALAPCVTRDVTPLQYRPIVMAPATIGGVL